MYGITLYLDHLEASKLFLLSWIQRWKPDPVKIFGDNLGGPMAYQRALSLCTLVACKTG